MSDDVHARNMAQNHETIVRLERMLRDTFVNVATEALRSIQDGSELTGAPGQPVQSGALKGSWLLEFPSETEAVIGSPLPYAAPIEDGIGAHGPLTLRSAVGGFHSVALTVTGMDRIVDHALARAVEAPGAADTERLATRVPRPTDRRPPDRHPFGGPL